MGRRPRKKVPTKERFRTIFWFDVETTGLDPSINDPVQIGYILEHNRKVIVERDFRMKPTHPYICTNDNCKHMVYYADAEDMNIEPLRTKCPMCNQGVLTRNASDQALDITGTNFHDLLKEEDPNIMYQCMKEDLAPFLDNTTYKRAMCAGYNSMKFDMVFLEKFLDKLAPPSLDHRKPGSRFRSLFYYVPFIDVYPLVVAKYYKDLLKGRRPSPVPNFRLSSMVKLAGKNISNEPGEERFHDALFDVRKTRSLFYDYVFPDNT